MEGEMIQYVDPDHPNSVALNPYFLLAGNED